MAAVAANPAPTLEHKVRPAKPDEGAFKSDLAKAEAEHSAVQEKLVCDSYAGCLALFMQSRSTAFFLFCSVC